MIDHDKFLRHLVRKAIEMQSQTVSHIPGGTWEDSIIQLARDTFDGTDEVAPRPGGLKVTFQGLSPQAAEHEVDVRYDRGCMR